MIPEHWQVVRLGDICDIETGKSNRVDSTKNKGKYVFFDRSQDIRTSDIYLFDGEAIIVAGEGQEFIPKYFIGKFDLHQRAYSIMNFGLNKGKFLYYSIYQNRSYFYSQAVGSTVKSLRLPIFEKLKLPLPPLAEQQKIANILTTWDNAIAKQKQLITAKQKLKTALMQQLLTGKTRFKQFSDAWQVVRLGEAFDARDGTHESPNYLSKGIPFITSKNLKGDSIDFSNVNYISDENHLNFSKRSKVNNGDILFGMIGTIGNPIIVNTDKDFSIKNVALIKQNNKVN